MAGRHRSPGPPARGPGAPAAPRRSQPKRQAGDPRPRRRRRLVTAVAIVAALAVGTPVAYAVVRDREATTATTSAAACARTVTVSVSANPDIADLVTELATPLNSPQQALDGACLATSVAAIDAAATATTLAQQGASSVPNVWIPDSSLWVGVARGSKPGSARVPEDKHPSIATSPVVMAFHPADATKMGWPDKPVSWRALIAAQGAAASQPSVRLELPDPTTSTVGLVTLAAALGGAADPIKLAEMTRRFAPVGVDIDGQLIPGLDAFLARAATEQWVWQQASDEDKAPFVAVPPAEPIPANDYPFVRVRSDDGSADAPDAAVDLLRRALVSQEARKLLHRSGFRAADGLPLTPPSKDREIGRVPMPQTVRYDPAAVPKLLGAWTKAYRRGKVLAVVDISGSMGEEVPGTRRTKLQLALGGAGRALGAFDDETELGLWVFSTDLGGGRDYRELLPVSAVGGPAPTGGTVRQAVQRSLPLVRPKPMGSTGLYDTTLAAFRQMQRSYDPRRLNTVVVLTDGRDQDERSIGAAGFFAALQREVDPRRPVRIIPIAYGADADVATLRRMAAMTGGALHVSRGPQDIDRVIWAALTAL